MPREPDEAPVTIQGFFGSKLAGTCTISETFSIPDPSPAKARYSSPATFPSFGSVAASRPTSGP
jgi:hypothetical protein